MKIAILAFALLGVVAADVSHLNNVYLPPAPSGVTYTQQVAHIQKSQDISQAPVQEVVDNSVTETVAPQEEQAQVVETAQYVNGGQDYGHVAQHVGNQVQAQAQQALVSAVAAVEPAAPVANVYQQSAQQQATYYTQPAQQQATYYTQPAQQQATYYTQPAQQQQQQQQLQPQIYYTRPEVQQPQQRVTVEVPAQQHVQHQQYHSVAAVAAPAVQTYAQQPSTSYYGQQSVSAVPSASASAGAGTQYAANGGYVY